MNTEEQLSFALDSDELGSESDEFASESDEPTYPCPNIKDYTLDDNIRAVGCPQNNFTAYNPSEVGLGALDALPLELLQGVLRKLDIRTLADFRGVNRRAREVTNSIPDYDAVIKHIPNVLGGILSIDAGRWITCESLYDKFCTAECEQCGDFGGYLYILTCKRICFLCLSEDKKYLPLRLSHAKRKFGVHHQILRSLPHMRSVQGTYSPGKNKIRQRLLLVDPESARHAGIALHGSSKAMEQYVSDVLAQDQRKYNKRISRAHGETSGTNMRNPRQPRIEDPLDGEENPLRFMAVVRMPWMNRASQTLESGFHCARCRKSLRTRQRHWRRKFTTTSFREHLRQHGDIRHGTHYKD